MQDRAPATQRNDFQQAKRHQKATSMPQQFIKVGDIVRLSFGFADLSGSGDYEIVRVMPTRENGERQYRVRGADGFERAISHGQLVGTGPQSSSPPG